MVDDKGAVSEQLLAMLRCPSNQSRLTRADDDLVQRVNQAIAEGRLRNVGGATIEDPIDGGLLREDGSLLYPIVDQIPVMLPDEAIEVSQL